MNNNEINLLVDKRNVKPLTHLKERLKIMRLTAIFILFVTGATSIILSILITFSPLPSLKQQEEKVRDELSLHKTDISKLIFLNDRGDSIRKILTTRSEYGKKIEIIQKKMPSDVLMEQMTISKKIYTLKFSSNNLASIEEFLNNIIGATGQDKQFLRVHMTSLSLNIRENKFELVINMITV